jgi:hypothetical protein
MSERALGFVETWIAETLNPDAHDKTDGGLAGAQALAAACRAAAHAEGISDDEINTAFDDLTAFIAGQIDEAVDRKEHPEVDDEVTTQDALQSPPPK